MKCSTATILAKIETLQLIQKTNHPNSDRWQEASRQLQPLFIEMAKRTK